MNRNLKTMKNLVLIVVTAVATSTITTFIALQKLENKQAVHVKHVTETPVLGAKYTTSNMNARPLDFTEVAKKVTPAAVHIQATHLQKNNPYYSQRQQSPFGNDFFEHFFGPHFYYESPKNSPKQPQAQVSSGSGVVISNDGFIVTNNHVIDGADDIEVTLNDNRAFKAVVVGTDPSTDIALLQIKEKDLPFIPFTNSDQVQVGEWVVAVGNPFNLNATVTAGIVSAKARSINILKSQGAIESFIQTDAAINPGNSGGALVDLNGNLVGINTAIASPTGAYSGYGFAVPSNIVNKVVDDLRTYGMVQRGYLGLMIRSVDNNLVEEKELQVADGVYVSEIAENSSAGDAGVKVNDVITEVNGTHVKTSSELLEMIGRKRPGDKVTLKVNRKGSEKIFEVVLKNKNGETELATNTNSSTLSKLGIELSDLDKKTMQKLSLSGGVKVEAIESGIVQRQTAMILGFIITRANQKQIKDKKQLLEILNSTKGGLMLEGVYENMPGVHYYAFGIE